MLKHLNSVRITYPTLFLIPKCTFSSKPTYKQESKTEAVGFKKNSVHNYKYPLIFR